MKTQLKIKPHSVLKDEGVIEVFWDGRLIATVTGGDTPGIRVNSKYPLTMIQHNGLQTDIVIGELSVTSIETGPGKTTVTKEVRHGD